MIFDLFFLNSKTVTHSFKSTFKKYLYIFMKFFFNSTTVLKKKIINVKKVPIKKTIIKKIKINKNKLNFN